MSEMSESTKIQASPPKGEYHPPGPDDLRAPCPVLNSLANHGIIARDGRNITAAELKAAMRYLGMGLDVATILVNGSFQVHSDNPKNPNDGARLGLRDRDQVNEDGVPILNLDQVGRPHATEHDVSVTRQDRALGDCIRVDEDLLKRFLAAPHADRGFGASDLGRYRKIRFEEQRNENPRLDFDREKHYLACAEVGALQCLFGVGFPYRLPETYAQAIFAEERLPIEQGWKPRRTPMMLPELGLVVWRISHFAWPF